MHIKKLQKLIQEGESHQVEFKRSTTQIKAAFTTVCAFLNGEGGVVVFGAKDNGELIGQQVSDKTKLELANEIKKIEPNVPISVHYIPIENGLQVIVLAVPQGKHAPYVYDARPYERVQSSTTQMTQHRYEQLIIQRNHQNHSWEKEFASEYSINDLDHDEIRKTVKAGVDQHRIPVEVMNYDIEHILANLELTKNGRLTNAAVVLFAKKISNDYAQCAIKLARFRGRDKLGDFIDSQWVRGNAFQLLQAAHDFTSRHLPVAGFFEQDSWKRIDQAAIPALALREALINSICHRDYTAYNTTLMLAIYDDRLELWNAGELPKELKLEQLKKPHGSYPRNQNIAHVFYKRGWIETWGTGITRIMAFCHENKTPEPELTEYSGGLSITFPFNEPMNSELQKQKSVATSQLTDRQQEILHIMSQKDSMTSGEINHQLNAPLTARTLRHELAILKEKRAIDSSGSTKNTIWFIVK